MQTSRTYVESFVKKSPRHPWIVSIASPLTEQFIRTTIGHGGKVEAGPRLLEVLSTMERYIDAYPFQFTYHKVMQGGVNEYTSKSMGDFFVYLEASTDTYRALTGKDLLVYGRISLSNDVAAQAPYDSSALVDPSNPSVSINAVPSGPSPIYDEAPSNYSTDRYSDITESRYLVVGTVAKIKDGDTIDINVKKAGSLAWKQIKENEQYQKDGTITIRYVGLNCPETLDHGEKEGNERNAEYSLRYNVSLQDCFAIGEEAKNFITAKTKSKTIVIDLDLDTDGSLMEDKYHRYIGVVYVMDGPVVYDTVIEKGFKHGLHLNKTLLGTRSKLKPLAPLGMPYDHFIDEVGYRRFDVVSWLYEVGVRTKGDYGGVDIKDIKVDLGDSLDKNADFTRVTDTLIQVKHKEPYDNRLEFVKPLDDRQEDIYGGDVVDSSVRIGDVHLFIPPLSIQVNRVSTLEKVKTLRSKSSIITKAMGSTTTLTLQLYFHDLDSINGKKWDNGDGMTYYMDGLRPLIAQFKKAPFLPIDNEYINNVLDVHDVALVNLNVTTVPGFPHSISATLTLAKFEIESYMPQVPSLGDAINYPLLRWYYQEAMKEPKSPYRTYLRPVENLLTNDFTFSLANEAQLLERKAAIEKLRNLDSPLIVKNKFENAETELGKLAKDGAAAQEVLKTYEKWVQLKKQGLMPDDNSSAEEMVSYGDTKYREIWKELYGKAAAGDQVTARDNWYAAYKTDAFLESIKLVKQNWKDKYENDKFYGIFRIKLLADTNINLFEKDVREGSMEKTRDGNGKYMIIPGNQVERLKQIINRGYEAALSVDDSIKTYYETQKIVEATEGTLLLEEFPIDDILATEMNVIYENTFVPIQTQEGKSPTLQYLGSQDPYIQVTFHAGPDGVAGIRALLDEAERYSSEYRLGITSGFLGIENDLTSLFGVTTVMPESVTINTMAPGNFEVQMTLCGFDKTQKRMETLEGLSPIYGDVDKKDRKVDKVSLNQDMAVIEHKMREMEVFPDLELPEYDELIAVLPKLGSEITFFENRGDGRFVDPDFYVATDWTMREYLKEMKQREHILEFVDFAGIKMFTSNKSDKPIDAKDPKVWEALYQLDAEAPTVGGAFTGADGRVSVGNEALQRTEYGAYVPSGVDVSSIKDWLVSDKAMEAPTLQTWANWGYGAGSIGAHQAQYEAWLDNPQPEEYKIYQKLYELVDKFWTTPGYAYNDKNASGKGWEEATYGTVDDVWRANYNVMASTVPALKKGKKVEEGKIKASKYKKYRPITRERLANYLKSILHIQSGWVQYRADGRPRTNFSKEKGTYFAGMGFIDIGVHATSIEMAQRLMWDWQYNLEYTIEYLFKLYAEGSRITKKPETTGRPWDWMVHAFGAGKMEDVLETPYYVSVLQLFKDRYNNSSAVYATPTSKVDPQVMRVKQGLKIDTYQVATGSKTALLRELEAVGTDKKTLDKLKKASVEEVQKAYEKKMDALLEGQDSASIASDALGEYASIVYGIQKENYRLYKDFKSTVYEETNKLLADVDPDVIFPEMFTDMIEYDMRGRLARAFPTFQMFIIDEGRWMTTYRLWDNLYGYNAIQSIDVHRSREIAADTAVISMTNVYSNLTSRPMSDNYEGFEYSFWDNLVLGNPTEEIIDARKELLEAMLLQTGARLHLRIGYGANAVNLPTVFNGTVTEIDAGEVVQIVAQGDGLELGNVMSGDPEDDNKTWYGKVTEPRDFVCQMLTSKGNWMKDVINNVTEGKAFKENPLGIQHFGAPAKIPSANISFNPYNENYGEAAQNIYSTNGRNTFSEWVYDRGEITSDKEKVEEQKKIPWSWDGFIPKFQGGDEDDIKLELDGQTPWDVTQTIAACTPDYIAAVHPFELRSTLFLGKPYYRLAYKYSSHYNWDEANKQWVRVLEQEHRKPYMQFHVMDSQMDIVQNRIKASADDIKTVVIAKYKGGMTMPAYADWDIHYNMQKTVYVDAPLIGSFKLWNFWTMEKQALNFAMSTLRDYMKKMYQGQLVVLGTPTIKPHDIVYMNDMMHEMNGNFLVRSVTHHFSYETGFVSNIEPDLLVVNDDKAMLGISNWVASAGMSIAAGMMGVATAKQAAKKIFSTSLARKAVELGKKGNDKAIDQALKQMVKGLPDDDPEVKSFKDALKMYLESTEEADKKAGRELMKEAVDKLDGKIKEWDKAGKFLRDGKKIKGMGSKFAMKGLLSTTRRMTDALNDGRKAYKLLKGVSVLTRFFPLSFIASVAIEWGVETLLEQWRRKKALAQAVIAMPLKFQGKNYEAGINGHKGMVVGDTQQGKLDNFFSGAGFNGKEDSDIFDLFGMAMNELSGSERTFITSEEDLNMGKIGDNE